MPVPTRRERQEPTAPGVCAGDPRTPGSSQLCGWGRGAEACDLSGPAEPPAAFSSRSSAPGDPGSAPTSPPQVGPHASMPDLGGEGGHQDWEPRGGPGSSRKAPGAVY